MDYDIARLTEIIPRLKSGELRVEMCEPQSQEWLNARFDGVGGSEVAALIGCGYGDNTPYSLWKSKRERIVMEANFDMERGSAMEEPVAKRYAKERNVEVLRVPMLVDVAKPWRRVNLDRIAIEDWGDKRAYVLEIKYSRMAPFKEIPVWYYPQVIYQMGMTGLLSTAHLAYSGEHMSGVDAIPVDFDSELYDTIVEAVDAFWQDNVLADNPPPPSTPDERIDAAVLGAISCNKFDAPPEANAIALRMREINTLVKQLETEKNQLKAQIADMMLASQASKFVGADKSWLAYTVNRAGNISYPKVIEALGIDKKTLDGYRGAPMRYIVCKVGNDEE
jgi:predicted phage-related endonuclease